MSILQFIKDQTTRQAVLLLDDVLSELDEQRQEYLLEMLLDYGQVILTTAIVPPALKKYAKHLFKIEQGNIVTG